MSTCEGAAGPFYEYGLPYAVEAGYPANGIFSSTEQWYRDHDSVALRFTPDADATARLGFDAFRATNVSEGDFIIHWDAEYCVAPCSYCDNPCDDNAFPLTSPDLVAPSRPELAFRTILVSTPDTSTLCPDLDVLEIDIVVTDDVEPLAHLGLVAYIAPTAEEVAQLSTPTVTFGFSRWTKLDEYTFTVILGESEGHVREGENPFISPDPMCVSIAAFDRAGNLSDRSATTCLDTNDANDPTVIWVDDSIYSSGCCDTGSGAGPATALLVAVVALVLRGTGRAPRPGSF